MTQQGQRPGRHAAHAADSVATHDATAQRPRGRARVGLGRQPTGTGRLLVAEPFADRDDPHFVLLLEEVGSNLAEALAQPSRSPYGPRN